MAIKVPGKRYGKRLEHSKVFGHGGHGKKGGYADLLITPLVDMFVIIVLFLIANFSATGEVLMMTKDIQLPEAINVKEIEMHPVVMISAEQVSVSGNIVGRVEDLVKDEYLNIPALEEKLRDMKKQFEDLHAMAQDDANAFKGDVNIQASKEVEFKIIKRVMFSCATAGYNNINFAVLTKGGTDSPPAASAAAPAP
ncbi:ExbD/TolR family protein [Stigmatella aurantiaca]|uniref:Adventurous gliding motility protein AglS n=1 Tax=Stigmatella aurantiaca (strain DW4/3-1) TaxID=378806 RepID=Q08PC5_STIAD|nr:biopolymer transporter ExbD [Stigmatella aurantiaca]ADO68800.1 Adventurous gliding motility protein AglS [Stigmatella aurantiaca DW4/3-1]EAU62330.1 adventurous gliding motility protein S [Stigmatella aurantiaca DW4/3-1]